MAAPRAGTMSTADKHLEHPKGDRSLSEGRPLIEVLSALVAHRRIVLGLPALVAVIAALAASGIPETYRSEVQIVPSRVATGPILMSLARSDLVRGRVIGRLELARNFGTAPGRETELVFEDRVATRLAKDGALIIAASSSEREFAAKFADALAEETIRAAHEQRLTSASMTLESLKARLAQVERNQRLLLERLSASGVKDWGSVFPAEVRGLVAAIADIEAELSAGAPDSNMIYGGVFALQESILQFERSSVNPRNGGRNRTIDPAVFDAVKELYFFAALKKHLDRRLEMADVDIRNEIKPINSAPVPLTRQTPKRSLIVALSVIAAFLVATLLALIIESQKRVAAEPTRADFLRRLKQAWRGANIE